MILLLTGSLSVLLQVMPIVDLMAISNTHFQKLKDFITCSFPAGFPVKIEIPLFHVLNAKVTFGNIFALGNSISGIQGKHLEIEIEVISAMQ